MFNLLKSLFLYFVLAIVGAMFAVGDTEFESDGQSVQVTLTNGDVIAKQVAVIQGWVGITVQAGESGEDVVLDVSTVERQWVVPSGLSVAKGATVYLEVADVTGHTPDDTAYSTSSGAGKIPLFKATSAKDSNDVVTGIAFPDQV